MKNNFTVMTCLFLIPMLATPSWADEPIASTGEDSGYYVSGLVGLSLYTLILMSNNPALPPENIYSVPARWQA